MNVSSGPIAAYRRFWLPELAVLLAAAVAATILFSVTDLDISSARSFYHPEGQNHWPEANHSLWKVCYRSAPWVTGSLSVAGVVMMLAGAVRRASRELRIYGIFILLCVVLGPGLIVNGILKDHWGRPRPREIVAFGGQLPYVPPLVPTAFHGKSFPCGHCSVGYLYGIGWWLWRRRRPAWRTASLATGLVVGTLLGFGRLAAGGHFLSDTFWAAWIAFAVAHVLYYYALRIPAREDSLASLFPSLERSPRRRAAVLAGGIVVGAGIVFGGIVASPHDLDLSARVRLADFPAAPETFEIVADTLDVELRLAAEPPGEIECTGHVYGFGLPTNKLRTEWTFGDRPAPNLRYRLVEKGWFPDIDGMLRIRLPYRQLRRIAVRVGRGDIIVTREPADRGATERLPELDLHTSDGRVRGL